MLTNMCAAASIDHLALGSRGRSGRNGGKLTRMFFGTGDIRAMDYDGLRI